MQKGIFVVDYRYVDEIVQAFGEWGIFIPSVPCRELAEPVSGHPDMTLFPDGKGTVVCAPSVFDDYEALLSPLGIKLVQGKKTLSKDYPRDVAYNVLNVGGFAFARWDSTDEEIISLLSERNICLVPVAQGYSKCSALSVGNGVVTADASIANAAGEAGLSVLLVEPGCIELPGHDYGFIGGATGILDEKNVAVFGDLHTHPQGQEIRRFVESQGFACQERPGRPLIDVGTILCVGYV
ncbi:MAG: hypothetical protein E7403_06440 [Ruminococcaceae bacterium]|nr:hypothetical protein [Oscillospiraceae bacterium]